MTEVLGANAEGHSFYLIALISAVLLLCFLRNRRLKFVVPSILMGLGIANPVFKDLWVNRLSMQYYWRILWIVPVIPLCAALPAMLSEKLKNGNLKGLVAMALVCVYAFTGSYMYDQRYCQFEVPAPNLEKLPGRVVATADYLLSVKEKPRIIADRLISVYIRQYSGEIETLYGRDIDGYIDWPSATASRVNRELSDEDGDLHYVARVMLDEGYDFLVTNDSDEKRRAQLAENGFRLQHHVEDYGIYTVEGTPRQSIERNELGQITSITALDESGHPIIGDAGYATASYQYDRNGYVSRTFRTDTEGNGIADTKGRAGWERAYDPQGRILMEKTLGPEGNVIENEMGYAEVRRKYQGDHIVEERYFDSAGKPVCSYEGYAAVLRAYNGQYLISEKYFDPENRPVCIPMGYAEVRRTYNDQGAWLSVSYYGEDHQPINQINGYAKAEREFDTQNRLIHERYYDQHGQLANTHTGYAEVRYEYFDQENTEYISYYTADGQPAFRTSGETAIEQEFDSEGHLIARRYIGPDDYPVTRSDGYSEAQWVKDEETGVWSVQFLSSEGDPIPTEGINLAKDIPGDSEGWSAWMVPGYNRVNDCFTIGTVNLGEKQEGDLYTCQLEIEFRNISATPGKPFLFLSQGAADGLWDAGNVWNGQLIWLETPPADDIYSFSSVGTVNSQMVNRSTFDLGFRCDYWQSGMFRVRKVKVEKGDTASEWSPGI